MNSEEEMKALRVMPLEEVCQYLGAKLKRIRKDAKESQEDFAQRAGVPLRTYKRLETQGKASLETFVQVLRTVERTHYLFMLFPQPGPTHVKASLEQRLQKLRPTKFL